MARTKAQKEASLKKADKIKKKTEAVLAEKLLSEKKEKDLQKKEKPEETAARHKEEAKEALVAAAKAKKLSIDTASKVKEISETEKAKMVDEQDAILTKHKFKNSDKVILKGNSNPKYGLLSNKEYKQPGYIAKKLIHKGAAEFVKVEKPEKDKK